MKCKFCQQECYLVNDDGVYGDIWVCDRHPLKVKHYVAKLFHKKGECEGHDCCPKLDWHVTIVQFRYRGATWCVNWFPGNERYPGPRLRIDRDDPDGEGGRVVVDLPFHPPDLTPETIETKVPLYISFS